MTHDTPAPRRPHRSRAIAARCAITLAGAAVLAACGSTPAPGSSGGGTSQPKVSLNITVQDGPGHPLRHWTLRCDPAGGTHPDAASACRALLALKQPFGTTPPGHACPMIVVSDKRVTFEGTWFGQKVHRTIIDGGCDLTRWSKLGQVVN